MQTGAVIRCERMLLGRINILPRVLLGRINILPRVLLGRINILPRMLLGRIRTMQMSIYCLGVSKQCDATGDNYYANISKGCY